MTDQEIVRAVGETVMGWVWDDGMNDPMFAPSWKNDAGETVVGGGWNPLTSLSDAGMLIEAMRGKGWWLSVESNSDEFSAYFWHPQFKCRPRTTSPKLEKSITLAALRALEVPGA